MSSRGDQDSELPDPLELFEKMRRLAEGGEVDSEDSVDSDLPDPAELFRQMERHRLNHLGDSEALEDEDSLPDPMELFEQMRRASMTEMTESVEEDDLPDPQELFEQMRRFAEPQKLESSSTKFPDPEQELLDDIHLPLPGRQTATIRVRDKPEPEAPLPYIPRPDEAPQAPTPGPPEELPVVGFFKRLKARFKKPSGRDTFGTNQDEMPVPISPEVPEPKPERLPTPEELFRQMRAEKEDAALNFELPPQPSKLPTIAGYDEGPLPSPEELFRQLEEENRNASPPAAELPALPDLDAIKAEFEAEERARLDPDLLGDLAGPERFVDTVSDSMFVGGALSSFLDDLPSIPEPDPEPKVPQNRVENSQAKNVRSKPDPPAPSDTPSPTGTVRVDPEMLRPEPPRRHPPLGEAPRTPDYIPTARSGGQRPQATSYVHAASVESANKAKTFKRFSRHKLAIYTRQMAVMLKAGIQLHLAISFAAESDPELEPLLSEVMRKVESGYTYSAAISETSRSFDTVYVGLVKAGEMSGRLHEMLARLADVMEREVELRKKIIAVVTYPIALLLVCFVGTLGFIFFILPTLTPLFLDLEVALPWPTQVLLGLRDVILPGTISAVVILIALYLLWDRIGDFIKKRPSLERKVATLPFLIPVVGQVYDKLVTARVLYSLATMLDVGITLNQALARSETTAGNALVAYKLGKARVDLADGAGVTDCFRMNGLFNASALHLISAGEESAKLSEMFNFVARLFDEEVEHALQSAASILEPMIMVLMGLIVGFITIAAALPTIHLLQNF